MTPIIGASVGNGHLLGIEAVGTVAVAREHRVAAALQHFLADGRGAVQTVFAAPFHALESCIQVSCRGSGQQGVQRFLGPLPGMGFGILLAAVGPTPTLDGRAVALAGFMAQPRLRPVSRDMHGGPV